ncbi:MAG: chitobiase/beta-hexosaminidase C-terminal domain-containing protein [Bacteroidales bacterium]|nr:chitobiase/beta-hexosaminidase C-terminal domain-containing protein [Bacteroidales bacterium]
MKKLLYSGVIALVSLFALTGLVRAQHTFTFDPPTGSTVAAGDEIHVTCTPEEEEISFEWFASMEEAQAAEPTLMWDVYGEDADGFPTIAAGKTVLKVGIVGGDVAYAEYTLGGLAAAPKLEFDLVGDKYGRYVPFTASLTYAGEDQQNFELYYALNGPTPSKEKYKPNEDEIMRVEATNGHAEIMLTGVQASPFKAIAYITVDGEDIASNMVEMNLEALDVAKPEFVPAPSEVEANTVVKIKDNTKENEEDQGATILYSKDGETLPLMSAYYDDDDPNVFLYKDEDGITITEDVTLWVIAYKSVGSDGFSLGQSGGSELLRGRFTVAKPAVNVSLSTKEWTIGTEAPTVTVTVPEGITLGTAEGNVAVELYIYSDDPSAGWKQIITASGVSLDMSKAIEAGHEDEWMLRCSLVKGNATTEAFDGDMEVRPEILSLVIVKDGEKPAAPEFSLPSGEVEKGTQVTLSCATEGATIYYTYGDLEVTTPYTQAFIINSDCAIRAMAEKDGIQSDITRVVYTIKTEPLPEPTITLTPAPGEIAAGTEIDIEVAEQVKFIYYRLYPTVDSAQNDKEPIANVGSMYPSEGKPVPTVENPVLRVGVFRSAETPREIRQWDYAVFAYQIMKDIPMPVISPAGGEVEKGTEVEITLAEGAEGAKIYYTTNDSVPQVGKDFTQEYTQKIVVNQAMTIKAMAVKTQTGGRDLVSNVAEAVYTVKGDDPVVTDTVKTPTFSVAAGEVEKGTKVALACATEDAKIYYTIDGSEPTAESAEYTAEISIDSAMTIKAIAMKEGLENSKVVSAAYTVKEQGGDSTAVETKELAGVSIYPNPTEGEFNVSVPANVEVEIFNAVGTMVKRMSVAEGVSRIRLNNSGIYFVRFTSVNGQVAIRKVVIR